jgi:hypothetical protein
MSQKRTPMEMSCWRGAWRNNPKGKDFRVFHGDWCFAGRVSGSELRKTRKRLKAELRAANVLNRRIARFGQTIYE